ncbi:MAG: dihydrolipoyl dehydrogenase family protein, partial [bacterium]
MSKYDYDVVVIGAGAAGLTSSGICASFGAKTALIEKHRLGGDCTWSGCIPSKALLHIAKKASGMITAGTLGVTAKEIAIDFSQVMKSVRQTRQDIYEEADSPEVMQSRGVEVLTGNAVFEDEHVVQISDANESKSVSFRSAIITAGGSPLSLPIPGLNEAGFLTNETLFELTRQPDHLVILGAGPIGIEMAQAFCRLGSTVTIIALDDRILIRDEPDCAEFIKNRLQEAGVNFHLGETIHEVKKTNGKSELAVGPKSGADKKISVDNILVAIGRKPNLERLQLDRAGVKFEKGGIPVDRYCRTNRKHILAAGDITTFMKFTHVAENMAKAAAINAVLRMPLFKYEQKVIPWVT